MFPQWFAARHWQLPPKHQLTAQLGWHAAGRYGLALLVVALAAVARWLLGGVLVETPFMVFYPALVAAAAFGGMGPGLLATLAAGLLVDIWFIAPYGQLSILERGEALRLGIFVGCGVSISVLAGLQKQLQRRGQQQAAALADNRRWFAGTIDSAMDAIISVNEAQRIVLFNPAAERMFGCPAGAAVGSPIARFIPEPLPAAHLEQSRDFDSPERTGRAMGHMGTLRGQRANGEVFPLEASISQVVVGGAKLLSFILRDGSERRQAEEALRESEQRLRLMADAMPQLVWMANADGFVHWYNRRWYEYTGTTAQQMEGWGWQSVHDPALLPQVMAQWTAAIRSGEPFEMIFPLRGADGQFRVFLTRAQPLKDSQGRVKQWFGTNTNVDELKRAEEAQARLAAIIESSDDAIISTGLDATVFSWNAAAQRLFGYTAAEMIGQPITRLLPPERAGEEEEILARIRRGEQCEHLETVRVTKDGQRIDVSLMVSPVKDRMGAVSGASKIIHDITARKQAQEDLEAAKRSAEHAKTQAERANQAKDEFLAVLSHELRNPLTPVLAAAALLLEEPRLDADTRQTLEMIHRNAELEARLIDDLLDVTRITRGKLELHREPLPLCTILAHAIEVCRPDIETRQIHFGVDLQGAPYVVDADAPRLQQVFWNLLKNAIKFTPQSGCVGVRVRGDGAQHVIVEVNDSGVGIAPEALPRIFRPFEQAERGITRQFGGLGLGLAISKAMVELHGGTIVAASDGKGKGASFQVRLRLTSIPGTAGLRTDPTAPAAAPGALPPARALRILLVEDHGDTAKIMSRLLRGAGHTVEHAADVATALKVAGAQSFDLLLSDMGLPDGSGLDIMRTLRSRGVNWPGIALSGYGMEQDIARSHEAGFAAHLTKPVNFHAVETAMRQVVTQPPSRRGA